MARSLRSKRSRAARAVKREDAKYVALSCSPRPPTVPHAAPARLTSCARAQRSDYKLKHDLRIQRLNAQLKASALKPRALTDKEEWEREQAGYETVDEDDEAATQKEEGDAEEGKKDGGGASAFLSRAGATPRVSRGRDRRRLARRRPDPRSLNHTSIN